jgi:hypothetical protein
MLEPLLNSRYQHPQSAYVFLQNGLGVEQSVYTTLKEGSLTATLISCAVYAIAKATPEGDIFHVNELFVSRNLLFQSRKI